jgi:hypothetical protein
MLISLASSGNYLCQHKGKKPASKAASFKKNVNFLIIR